MGSNIIVNLYYVVSILAMMLLCYKAKGDFAYDIRTLGFMPVTFHRLVFGSGFMILIPIAIYIVGIFFLSVEILIVLLIFWHFYYSLSTASAYGTTILLAMILLFLPGIGMIILGFGKSEYQGPSGLLGFVKVFISKT
ncbi:MAG: hypothetical protein FWD19_01340 [Defluviitaleaceae bacterium]|nr:hypothetical protein [Defluviitaleaceae bacterium]